MTQRATTEQLRRARTTEVTVHVDGEPVSFLIRKIKVGDRKRLRTECVDQYGLLDAEHVARLSCELCVVEPILSAEDIEETDVDVWMQLADEVAQHSNLKTIQQAATPDPSEGAEAVKGFPVPSAGPGVGRGVDEAAGDAGARLDA